MPSELAKQLSVKVSLPVEAYAVVFDESLQEVREVLDLFEEEWMTPHDYEHEIGFVPKDVACDECDLSKRARALMARLRVDGASGDKPKEGKDGNSRR